MTIALVALTLAAMVQPTTQKMWAALTFVAFTVAHEVVLSGTTGLLYYGSAATFDVMIAFFIGRLTYVPESALLLIRICWVSVAVNAIGYFMYLGYFPPTLYDAAMLGVFGAAILAFGYQSGADDVGDYAIPGGRASIFGPLYSNSSGVCKSKGAT